MDEKDFLNDYADEPENEEDSAVENDDEENLSSDNDAGYGVESEDDDLDDVIEDDDIEDDIDDSDENDDLDDEEDDGEAEVKKKDKDKRSDNKSDKKAQKKEERDRKKKEKLLLKVKKSKVGLRIVPYEAEEDKNPVIKVYNEMVRHAYDYDENMFSREGLSDSKIEEIYSCITGDFPELFWLKGYRWNGNEVGLNFRCKKPNGELDIKQIERKLRELKIGARFFTRGITKRTDPYQALVTIYKRLILTIDYDGQGLNARIDTDVSKDDRLRSLHSALVRHKTVCAGYAVAMQYLLQSVGIPCAYVISEVRNGECHAFNIAKIGKYCYYLDVTWGDRSNTLNGSTDSDKIDFEYCCVPYEEFIMTSNAALHNHIPNHEIYPWFKKELKANRHEYYRYHKAFVSKYNEDDIALIFANTAKRYNPKEDGRFCISLRCTTKGLANRIRSMILSYSNYMRIVGKAKKVLAKDKRAIRLLDGKVEGIGIGDSPVVKIWYVKENRK